MLLYWKKYTMRSIIIQFSNPTYLSYGKQWVKRSMGMKNDLAFNPYSPPQYSYPSEILACVTWHMNEVFFAALFME